MGRSTRRPVAYGACLRDLPSFDLVVATIGRVAELTRLLDSLSAQTHRALRVIVVDQNHDDRLAEALARDDLDVVRLTAPPGLARARNAALSELTRDVVAFPDDDCVYPQSLLERVAQRLARDPTLDGVSAVSETRPVARTRVGRRKASYSKDNVWNLVASAGLFLRRPSSSGSGASTSVSASDRRPRGHPARRSTTSSVRSTAGAGSSTTRRSSSNTSSRDDRADFGLTATARASGTCSASTVIRLVLARMTIRPVGGTRLARRSHTATARYHVATLRGRVRGYLGARSSKSSA